MVDYRRFLGKTEALVLPWLGGGLVHSADRRFMLERRPPKPGWYRFTISKRRATPDGEADAPSLEQLPRVRGHLNGNVACMTGGVAEPVHLLPADEPPRFSLVSARRWHDGSLLFEQLEFETEAEAGAREAFARGAAIDDVKGVPATLRAAAVLAAVERVAKQLAIAWSPVEIRPYFADIAARGAIAAETALRRLEAERAAARRALDAADHAAALARVRDELDAARRQRHVGEPLEHAANVLAAAGAHYEDGRRLAGDRLEVIFRFMDDRFIAVADAHTLQVLDSGICLGHPAQDQLLTLDSLPGVIREAIEDDRLVKLRHA